MLEDHFVPSYLRHDGIVASIEQIEQHAFGPAPAPEHDDQAPVFILSAGWRTGSTLLQRLLCSDGKTLIWGEPFGDLATIPRLHDAVLNVVHNRAHRDCQADFVLDELSLTDAAIANLNPGFVALRTALRSFCDSLFVHPSQAMGYERWGGKFVRMNMYHAYFLHWLYPNARTIFLVRDPVHAFNSYKWKTWHTRAPDWCVNSPLKFAAHWAVIARSYLALKDRMECLLVRYEDLCSKEEVVVSVEEFTGISLAREVFSRRVGSSNRGDVTRPWDRAAVRLVTSPYARRLGYD